MSVTHQLITHSAISDSFFNFLRPISFAHVPSTYGINFLSVKFCRILGSFKGTVRPYWICMRVVPLESPLKGHQPLYVFDFLISVLNIWNNFKVLSRFMQNWTHLPACSDHGLHRIMSSYCLAHFYLMKKSAKELLYFALDCGMMKFFTFKPRPKEQLMPLPHQDFEVF